MPNRLIKESLLSSERISELTDFEFRLWIVLILLADDFGCGDARPAIIKGHGFPLRERVTAKDISCALEKLAAGSCVTLYKVGGRPYYQFPGWQRHQRIRNSQHKFPTPENADEMTDCSGSPRVAASCGELPRDAAGCGLNPIQSESNTNPNPKENTRAPARFAPPTEEEVKAYADEMGYADFNATSFVAYYEANGWRVGKNPMKDWKAAVRGWHSRDRDHQHRAERTNPATNYAQQRDYSDADSFFIDLDKWEG